MVDLPTVLELRSVEGMGRGVFSRTLLSAGTTLMKELPLVHCSTAETRGSVCEHCLLEHRYVLCGGVCVVWRCVLCGGVYCVEVRVVCCVRNCCNPSFVFSNVNDFWIATSIR